MIKRYAKRLVSLFLFVATTMAPAFTQVFTVDAPASLAGEYAFGGAEFGPRYEGFSGTVVEILDMNGLTTGCVPIDNAAAITGNVALIDRGTCSPVEKVFFAQSVGAVGAIICNNNTSNPDSVSPLTGSEDCQIDIPAVMLSYNACQAIRVEAGVLVSYTAPPLPPPGEDFETAIDIMTGTHTVEAITGNGGLFNGSTGAAWYRYVAPADGVLTISSCGSSADTRLVFATSPGGCVDDVQIQSFSLDAGPVVCPDNPAASELEVPVEQGEEYYIIWDDAQSAAGFDFTLSLDGPSVVRLELNVNMELEDVSPDGVRAVIGRPGLDELADVRTIPMDDEDGDGIYSGSFEVATFDTVGYAFVNGLVALENIESVPEDCGVLNAFGFYVRPLVVTAVEDTALEPVCFGLCTNCPLVEVAFTVDMSNESVRAEGMSMIIGTPGAGSLGEYEVVPMTDNGDRTWSASLTLSSGLTVDYAFVNGVVAVENIEEVPGDCGWATGLGFEVRRLEVEGFTDFSLDKVCFSTCLGDCPEINCAIPPAIFENLDSYTAGEFVGPQSELWTVWPGSMEGGPADAPVTDERAFSPPNSVKIEGQDGPDDVLLNIGRVSEGKWDLRFKIFVEPGFAAFYNLQNNEGANPPQWNLDVSFGADGTLGGDVSGTYPQGEWIDVIHIIDLDNEMAELVIDSQSVHTWHYGPDWSIGAIDFFPGAGDPHLFYIDDVILRPVVFGEEAACPEGALLCDGFEPYLLGRLSPQSANWNPGASSPDRGGLVEPGVSYEGCNALFVSDEGEGPNSQLLLLDSLTAGNYLLEWRLYIPEGRLGNYNIGKFGGQPEDELALQVEFFPDGSATLDAGGADVAAFSWQTDTWIHFQHFIDLDNNWIRLLVDGEQIYSWPANWQAFQQQGITQLGTVEFFGKAGVTMYVDNVLLQQLPSLPGNTCFGANDIQNLLGQGVDMPVVSNLYDNTNYISTGQDPDFGYECFGEPATGAPPMPSLERTIWFTFEGDGNEYHITTVSCNATDYIDDGDTQIAVYTGDGCSNLTALACGEDIDTDNQVYEAEVSLQTEAGLTYYLMVDGFGPSFDSDGEYCLQFTQLTELINTVTVTFQVDASLLAANGELSEEGMYLAGSFNDFEGQPMAEGADNIWTAELALDPEQTYTYKFQNGPGGWEEIDTSMGEDCTTGETGDRFVEVGDADLLLDPVCFGFCIGCDMVNNVNDVAAEAEVQVFPNPASEWLNVRIQLEEPAEKLSVRLVNAFGQVVAERELSFFRRGDIGLSLKQAPAGAYLLQVVDGKVRYTRAVIVE